MEEWHEWEVVWPENFERPNVSSSSEKKDGDRTLMSTAPTDVPSAGRAAGRELGGSKEEEEAKLVPPHVLMSRNRILVGKAAFSVCSGQGRTLKGRDLCHFRNTVLRMTGFLEG